MFVTPTPIFAPTLEQADQLIAELGRPDVSFLDLAQRYSTTPELLALWMTRPGIRDRLAAIGDVLAWRSQFVVHHLITQAAPTLTEICRDFTVANAQPVPIQDPERAILFKLRRTESARRAAGTFFRLATLRPVGPPTVRPTCNQPEREAAPPSPVSIAPAVQRAPITSTLSPAPSSTPAAPGFAHTPPRSAAAPPSTRPQPAPSRPLSSLHPASLPTLSSVSTLLELAGSAGVPPRTRPP